MNDVKVIIVHAPADAHGATQLKSDLDNEIVSRNVAPPDRPEITLKQGFENLPDPAEIGTLSLLVVYLPDPTNGFSPGERDGFETFRKKAYPESRLIPVASVVARDRPPAPLGDIKSVPLHQANGAVKLATLLLNLLCLRLAGDRRRVFVSYKISDGQPWAEAVAKGLRDRGYDVWRDDDADRDGLTMLTPGEPAQTTIRDAIIRNGFVLLIDTPEAPLSGWVQEEVATAISYLLPILPVVIEAQAHGNPRLDLVPRPGGRFNSLRDLGREVRVRIPPPGQKQEITDTILDDLERTMNDTLLGHLRDRRRLVADTREGFRRQGFSWTALRGEQLLYEASLSRNSELTPELHLKLLVQCAPYGSVLAETVRGACGHFCEGARAHQYVALVHRAALYPAEKRRLITGNGHHVMLLHTDEIAQLPSVFKFT